MHSCIWHQRRFFIFIEIFVLLLYDHTSTCSDVNLASERKILGGIPPTWAALEQHVERCTYQGSYSWGQTFEPSCTLPSPCYWGRMKDRFSPCGLQCKKLKSYCELISCKCKKWLYRQCKCKKEANALDCYCGGECQH